MTETHTIQSSRVAVVGGAGFLGSHLVDYLIQDCGCDVLVLDNLSAGRLEFVHPEADFEHADITGSETHLLKTFQLFRPHYVFNYAAAPYVPDSYERPLHVFEINANGALKVINAAAEAGVRRILQVSSAEIYGHTTQYGSQVTSATAIDEDGQIAPHSSYGASKAAIDWMIQVRYKESRTPVLSLRQFNCLGERDELHPYVVPEIMFQLQAQRERYQTDPTVPVVVRLGNNSFRDFMYAGDAVRMAVDILMHGQLGSVYNLGSQTGIRIYELAELIGKLMGFASITIEIERERIRAWEIWRLLSDNTRVHKLIDRRPEVSLEESLERMLNYYESVNWRKLW